MTNFEGQRQTDKSVRPREATKPPDPEYRGRIIANGRRAGKSARVSAAREQFEKEHAALFVNPDTEVLGVLTGQVPVRSMPIATNERWECGPHTNAWGGHDARCRKVPLDSPRD